jgi:hypothetical protein
MKPWFALTFLCWALVCLLLSLSQQAGLYHPLHVAGSGPWVNRCREPGSPAAAVLRSMEFDQARAAPLEFLALDCAMIAGNMGPPGQEIHGPPQSMIHGALASWRSKPATQSNHRITFLHKITARPIEFEEIGVLQLPLTRRCRALARLKARRRVVMTSAAP